MKKPVCRNCGNPTEASTPVDNSDATPSPGNICICAYCATISQYDEDLSLKPVSPEFLVEMYTNCEEKYHAIIKHVERIRKNPLPPPTNKDEGVTLGQALNLSRQREDEISEILANWITDSVKKNGRMVMATEVFPWIAEEFPKTNEAVYATFASNYLLRQISKMIPPGAELTSIDLTRI